jgi:hypothetical protein
MRTDLDRPVAAVGYFYSQRLAAAVEFDIALFDQ